MHLRLVIGLAVSVSLQMLLGVFAATFVAPSPSGVAPMANALQAGVIALLASGAGAYAARQPFLYAALALWALGWVSSLLVVQGFGGSQLSVGDALRADAAAIIASGLATVLGVYAGRLLDRRVHGPAAEAAD